LERIKLIWDFRGREAKHIAEHHKKHLQEYVDAKSLDHIICGSKDLSPMYSIAFMVVNEEDSESLRSILRPHRGQIYQEE